MLQAISSIAFLFGLLLWALTAPTRLPLLTLLAAGIHELGHLAAALALHLRPTGIAADTLGIRLLFGNRMLSYREELILSASGPLFNLLSALLFHTACSEELRFFLAASAALALLNLLPISGFDGGRMLSCTFSMLFSSRLSHKLSYFTSFFSLFVLWCISVYLILRAESSLSLFFFSLSIFSRIFLQKTSP